MGGNTFIPEILEILEREHLRWVGGNDTWNDGNEEKGAILIFIINAAKKMMMRGMMMTTMMMMKACNQSDGDENGMLLCI